MGAYHRSKSRGSTRSSDPSDPHELIARDGHGLSDQTISDVGDLDCDMLMSRHAHLPERADETLAMPERFEETLGSIQDHIQRILDHITMFKRSQTWDALGWQDSLDTTIASNKQSPISSMALFNASVTSLLPKICSRS
ncbi:hypothetical protein JCM3766R1_000108 [Sporobolomyces carnicolor]